MVTWGEYPFLKSNPFNEYLNVCLSEPQEHMQEIKHLKSFIL